MLDVPTVSALPAAHTVELSISGMTCAACASRVEKKLTRIAPGIVAAVNFATERATVTTPEDVPVQTMIAEKMNPTALRPRMSGSRNAVALAVSAVFTTSPGAAWACTAAMPV